MSEPDLVVEQDSTDRLLGVFRKWRDDQELSRADLEKWLAEKPDPNAAAAEILAWHAAQMGGERPDGMGSV